MSTNTDSLCFYFPDALPGSGSLHAPLAFPCCTIARVQILTVSEFFFFQTRSAGSGSLALTLDSDMFAAFQSRKALAGLKTELGDWSIKM